MSDVDLLSGKSVYFDPDDFCLTMIGELDYGWPGEDCDLRGVWRARYGYFLTMRDHHADNVMPFGRALPKDMQRMSADQMVNLLMADSGEQDRACAAGSDLPDVGAKTTRLIEAVRQAERIRVHTVAIEVAAQMYEQVPAVRTFTQSQVQFLMVVEIGDDRRLVSTTTTWDHDVAREVWTCRLVAYSDEVWHHRTPEADSV